MSTRKAMFALTAIATLATTAIAPSSASAFRFGGGHFGEHFGGRFGGHGAGPRSPLNIFTGWGNTHWPWPPFTRVCSLKECIAGTCSPC
jgi:hypothetical protein